MCRFQFFLLCLFLISTVTLHICDAQSQFIKDAATFTKNLIHDKFYNCEIIFVHDGHENYTDEIHYVLENLLSSNDNGLYSINIWSPYESNRFGDIHRLSTFCEVAVLMIYETRENIYLHMFQLLTQLYGPLIRKDQDPFIFLSNKETNDLLMWDRAFGRKIKYKLSLVEGPNNDVEAETLCFYCVPGGHPEIIQLPISDIIEYYIIDYEESLSPLTESSSNVTEMTTEIGALNPHKKFEPDVDRIFPDLVRNFNGHVLRMTNPTCLWRFEIEWRDGRYHPKRGSYKLWLDEAMRKFNFTYDVFYSYGDRGTGQELSNGTWFGTVSDIMHDRADLGFATGQTTHRNKHVGFSFPLSYEWLVFSTAQPKTSYSWKAIFWPFTPVMWGLLFSCVICIGIAFNRLAQTQGKKGAELWTASRTAEYIIATFLEEDKVGPSNLPFTPIRIFAAFWLLFSLIVATAYRAKLVSVIAFPVPEWAPETFEELSKTDKFGVGLHYLAGAAYNLFKSSSSPIYRNIFNKFELFPDDAKCFIKTTQQPFSCIAYEGVADYVNAKNTSDKYGRNPLVVSKETTFFLTVGLIMEERSIFHLNFDKTIQDAVNMGLTLRWIVMDEAYVRRLRWEYEATINKTKFVIQDAEGPIALRVKHFVGAFFILFSGELIGCILFVHEMIRGGKMKTVVQNISHVSKNTLSKLFKKKAKQAALFGSIYGNENESSN